MNFQAYSKGCFCRVKGWGTIRRDLVNAGHKVCEKRTMLRPDLDMEAQKLWGSKDYPPFVVCGEEVFAISDSNKFGNFIDKAKRK